MEKDCCEFICGATTTFQMYGMNNYNRGIEALHFTCVCVCVCLCVCVLGEGIGSEGLLIWCLNSNRNRSGLFMISDRVVALLYENGVWSLVPLLLLVVIPR